MHQTGWRRSKPGSYFFHTLYYNSLGYLLYNEIRMTLTQAANLTRRGVVVLIVLIFLGLVGIASYNIWYRYYYLTHLPKIEEKAEMKFGVLPPLNFPPASVSSANYAYSVDTKTGALPQTPKLMKVYFLPHLSFSLMSPEKGNELASKLGFPNGPEILSPNLYKYSDDQGGSLTIDLTTGNFHLQRMILSANPVSSDSGQISSLDKTKTVSLFKDYLSGKGLLPPELGNGRSDLQIPDSNQPQLVEVSLWPQDFDNLPLVSAYLNSSLVRALIDLSFEGSKMFQKLDYTFWPIDSTTSSTYPLKSAQKALADLQGGMGFISLEPTTPQVSLTSVYLAYFEAETYFPYLIPVYVFEGPHFAALVPAL